MKKIYMDAPKSYEYYGLILLLLLNTFDGLITYIGLEFGFYKEINVLLNNIYNYSSSLFLIIKLLIPTIVFTLLILNLNKNLSKITKLLIYIANIVYILISLYHIVLLIILIQSII